jgi:hypothetical protein
VVSDRARAQARGGRVHAHPWKVLSVPSHLVAMRPCLRILVGECRTVAAAAYRRPLHARRRSRRSCSSRRSYTQCGQQQHVPPPPGHSQRCGHNQRCRQSAQDLYMPQHVLSLGRQAPSAAASRLPDDQPQLPRGARASRRPRAASARAPPRGSEFLICRTRV